MTGHDDGVITIDLAESDDARREQRRAELGEPYRTVLGHFRHEIGHYYEPILVDRAGERDAARELFGDDRADYDAALERHYAEGPPPDWRRRHVSAYAAMHPWEDWAETFAHYLHIRDTLQTAAAFGLLVTGPADAPDPTLMAIPPADPGARPFAEMIEEWLPAHVRAQRGEPEHGPRRPLSVHPSRDGHRQADVRARPRARCGRRALSARGRPAAATSCRGRWASHRCEGMRAGPEGQARTRSVTVGVLHHGIVTGGCWSGPTSAFAIAIAFAASAGVMKPAATSAFAAAAYFAA